LRYPGYDYAQPGAVYITVCTYERQHLFGCVDQGLMRLNYGGSLVTDRWQAIPAAFPEIGLDAWVVMPDHLHGIVFCGTDPDARRNRTVGEAVRWFKASVVEGWRIGVRDQGWPRYDRHLWQRDYHDRILRTERELETRRRYIEGNPGRWWEKYGDGT
jgi:REP element-mobilizing transposase RayT